MILYKSFIKFPDDDEYYDDWRIFSQTFPTLIADDRNFQKLIETHFPLREKWNELKADLMDRIEEELAWIGYAEKEKYTTPDELYKGIIEIANQTLSAGFFRHSLENPEAMGDLSGWARFYNFDGEQSSETIIEYLESNQIESSILADLKEMDKAYRNFRLDQQSLYSILVTWGQRVVSTITPIKANTVFKQLEYFDPAVYSLIKSKPELLQTMDWRLFEEMLADILKTFGYTIELTKKTKDGGIDVIAIRHDNEFGHHKYLLQAKRYNKAVQVEPVRSLMYLHREHQASKSCLATTSSFTRGAWEMADRHRWTLELKDKHSILKWIDRVIDLRKVK